MPGGLLRRVVIEDREGGAELMFERRWKWWWKAGRKRSFKNFSLAVKWVGVHGRTRSQREKLAAKETKADG